MLNIYSSSKKIYTFILGLFFPVKCLNCSQYGEIICLECAKEIAKIKTLTCPECGRISEGGQYCKGCRNKRKDLALKGINVAARYDAGPVKEIIHHLKYSGFVSLSDHLGELICQQIVAQFQNLDFIVVPVPLHISRKNRRGFNQSELIARYVSRKLNLPGGDALMRNYKTKNQVGLPRGQRLTNLLGAFSCSDAKLVKGQKILLIDDVSTTRATLNECAKALKAADAREVWGVVVARNI